jgi:UDP-4-amino-4,6-dideoxy-N-acetyl-beta-L-altrosamine N-acetyltransferase
LGEINWQECRLRPMTESDLEQVLEWRNHPDVRRHMITRREIGMDEHREWFQRCQRTGSRQLLLFQCQGVDLGFVGFSRVQDQRASEWGFYLAPGAPKGTGNKLGGAAVRHAFELLNVHKIFGHTLGTNTRGIRFHQRMGFRVEGLLREQHFDGEQYQDVVCFGLLRDEWLQTPAH